MKDWEMIFIAIGIGVEVMGIRDCTKSVNVHKAVIGFLLILVMLICIGSTCVSTTKYFEPIERERPVTLFGRYNLTIFAAASLNTTIDCYLNFSPIILETETIDTIPILSIDSLCIEGNCVGGNICYHSITLQEVWGESEIRKRYKFKQDSDDIYIYSGELYPVPYFFEKISIPDTCKDQDVVVWLHARLLDRKTKQLLKQESKKIQFQIRKHTGLDIGA
jgi:hypothetical protein